MQTIKTSELTGAALDWAVAMCEGKLQGWLHHLLSIEDLDLVSGVAHSMVQRYSPSTNWAQGGPIIEKANLRRITTNIGGGFTASKQSVERTEDDDYIVHWAHGSGPSVLVAVMRCYVASKLGETVDIPEELVTNEELQ